MRPDRDHYFGRIWRVEHKDATKLAVPDLSKAGVGELAKALASPNLPVRATASAFCYHQGAIFGGLVAPVLAYFAVNFNLGYAIPMLVGTVAAAVSVVIALSLSPETKGKVLVAELQVA